MSLFPWEHTIWIVSPSPGRVDIVNVFEEEPIFVRCLRQSLAVQGRQPEPVRTRPCSQRSTMRAVASTASFLRTRELCDEVSCILAVIDRRSYV